MPIKVLVCGAAGRMGREVVKAVHADAGLQVVGGVDVARLGEDVGAVAGVGPIGCSILNDLREAIAATKPEVAVIFASPVAVVHLINTCVDLDVSPVVGSTGWYDRIPEVESKSRERNVPVFVAPNFAIGAALMMKFAQQAAQYLDHVEIIELHHNQKVDAPSGTAEWTARLIAESRERPITAGATEKFNLEGVRGGDYSGIHIHSVRLPGFVAHQEIIFGGLGQILTIRHDSIDRTSFMPGVLHAIKKVRSLQGVTIGLEKIL